MDRYRVHISAQVELLNDDPDGWWDGEEGPGASLVVEVAAESFEEAAAVALRRTTDDPVLYPG